MKESFQNTTSRSERKIVNDVDAMRALAHPARLAILLFLLAGEPRTATECSEDIGESPSACSYHLRELERFGFVERVDPGEDGRARPWRATAIGLSVGSDWTDESMPARTARHAIARAELDENRRLAQRFFEAADDIDTAWKDAVDFHTFELVLTPDELQRLNDQIADLLRPFRPSERAETPDDAGPVHVVYQAFPRVTATR